ncbi:MAG: DUF3566 domain-containing protein [bacterium]|nr:DUF3566 domain-containing protein [bacterium]MBK8128402.1 DUF3566 domain-containing protein [bacterium]
MRREITRIEPRSAIRVGFFIGMLFGILFGLYSAVLLKGMGDAGMQLFGAADAAQLKSLTGVSTFLLALFMGLMGALFYSLISGLCAVVYNLAARWFGGIEYQVQEIEDTLPNASGEMND